ncbi:MAG TPA: helix-turn-helix transcriptional regulator [Alphaproteobacteria bacterium]|nr:helix-turn-helix transcriptional regulator [Alphaproteobacteria bacterium]
MLQPTERSALPDGPARTGSCPADALEEALARFAKRHGIPQRERQMLRCLLEGRSNRRTADLLGLRLSTVKLYNHALFRRIGAGSRLQAGLLVLWDLLWAEPAPRFRYADQAARAAALAAADSPLAPVWRAMAATERERQLLCGILCGMSNKQIGARFGLSTSAVKTGLSPLFRRLGVEGRLQAALWVFRRAAGRPDADPAPPGRP